MQREEVTGVVLSGGRARRLGGVDKGLLSVAGMPLVERVLARLAPQVGPIAISANRNVERYGEFGHPVVSDVVDDMAGPLAGILSAMEAMDTPYLLCVPCDAPCLPTDLAERLYTNLAREQSRLCIANDGNRLQPVFALLDQSLAPELRDALGKNLCKVDQWMLEHGAAVVDFSDQPESFANVNTPEDLEQMTARLRRGERC